MYMSRIHEDSGFRSESPEQYRLDRSYSYGRYRSLSNSRASHRSSVRDETQTLDEFLRKQRVIRYMEEERERAARIAILRREHNAWVEFRAAERLERLKYLNEQEIKELLQREAEEALREKVAGEIAAKRAAEETILRRQGLTELRKKKDESLMVKGEDNAAAKELHQRAQGNLSQSQAPLAEIEDTRRVCLELRRREEELEAGCNRLKEKLSEVEKIAACAVKDREKAEEELVRERKKSGEGEADTSRHTQLQKQVELLKKQLADLHGKLALTEVDRKRLSGLVEEKSIPEKQLRGQLKMRNVGERSSANQCAQESMTTHNEGEKEKLKQVQKEAEDLKKNMAALRKELAARDKQIIQYKEQLSLVQKRLNIDTEYSSHKVNGGSEKGSGICEKDKQELRRLQKSLEKVRAELQLVSQERDSLQRILNDAKECASVEKAKVVVETADQKTIGTLKKRVDILLSDTRKDAVAIQCLKNELQAAQEELKYETATRAKFEELAAQAIDRNGNVPKAELLRLQQQLQESDRKLREAYVEAEETRRSAQEEIQHLKNWCRRLRERQDKQMRDVELALQNDSKNPQRGPRIIQKIQAPDLRAKTVTKNPTKAEHQTVESTSHGKHNGIQERGKSRSKDTKASFSTTSSMHPYDQEIQMELRLNAERLERENAELRHKYDLLAQKYDSVRLEKSTEGVQSESKHCAYMEKAVQADVMRLEEPVLSTQLSVLAMEKVKGDITRADALNTDHTKLESNTANPGVIIAEEKEINEAAKENTTEVKMEVLGSPSTQAPGTEQTTERVPAFSKIDETNYALSSSSQKEKHREKTKCKCF